MNQSNPAALTALSFNGVQKRYAGAAALSDVTFSVPTGQIAGLVGVNGAGKTTLLKCLLDFCEFDAGSIEILGAESRRTAARARVAYLPERFVPPYYLTGREFLRHMCALYGAPYADRDAMATLTSLDLDHAALAKPVRAYSKGMTQKLGLAFCLMSRRDVLLLDEPASGLDPRARALLKLRMREVREFGRTVLFTSHTLPDVDEVCDQLTVLHLAKVRFVGTPGEFKSQFKSTDMETAYLACIDCGP